MILLWSGGGTCVPLGGSHSDFVASYLAQKMRPRNKNNINHVPMTSKAETNEVVKQVVVVDSGKGGFGKS